MHYYLLCSYACTIAKRDSNSTVVSFPRKMFPLGGGGILWILILRLPFGLLAIGDYIISNRFFLPMWVVSVMLSRRMTIRDDHFIIHRLYRAPITFHINELTKIKFHSGRDNYRSIILIFTKKYKVAFSIHQRGFWNTARFLRKKRDVLQVPISYGMLNSEGKFWSPENREGFLLWK